jgi:Tol biopolymer transport system component
MESDRGGRMNLWRVPIDEATGTPLGEPQPLREPGVDTAYVQFAKDGKRFAFVQRTFTSSIYKAAFDPERGEIAGKPAAITQGQLASRPDVSADGKRIVFESTIDKDEDLYSMDINGGGYRPLMQDPDKDRGPRWSPDGKRVAFFSTHSGTWQIWLSDADGQHQRQVTNRANSIYPVWSPAGDRLITTVMANTPADYQSFVIKLLPDLRVESMQSLPPLGDPNESFTPWSWSPDGRSLAGYRQGLDGRVTGITIFDFQSQKYNPVTTFGSEPVWLHHSPRLLFLHQGKIYLLDVREPARAKVALSLAPNDIARRGFGVSNDDRTIVFGLEEVQSDLWLGKLKDPQNPPGGN